MTLSHGVDTNQIMVPLLLGPSGQPLMFGVNSTGTPVTPLLGTNGEPIAYGADSGAVARKLRTDTSGRSTPAVYSLPALKHQQVLEAAEVRENFTEGFSTTYRGSVSSTSLSTGTNTLTLATFPSGYITIVESMCYYYIGTSPQRVLVQLNGSTVWQIYGQASPTSYNPYTWAGNLSVTSTENLQITVIGATANDDLYFFALGRSAKITTV